MDFPTAELLPVPRIFLATLLHFVWQATVVVALVAIARGLIQPRYCQVRYAISVVGIVVVLALPLMTFGYYTASPESLAFASPLALQDSMVQSGMVSGAMSEPGSLFAVCESQFQTVFTWFDSCRSLWLGGWLLGFAVLVLRLSLSLGHCFRLRRDQTPLPAPLQRIADDLKLKLNLTQGIIVGVSTHITQAVATGVIKPVVLIPAACVTQLPLT
ncbi:MAG: beta-lactamase regulating signal transducer with metallopeptidase domain, partial [Mariniblastus sp.]